MIAIVDYGLGNLRSVAKACEAAGFNAEVTSEKERISKASHVILPGVGAAESAISCLKKEDLWDFVIGEAKSGKPFLGICLGMQLLFDESLENGRHKCLGLIPGVVRPFDASRMRVPHIGWNKLEVVADDPIMLPGYVYFVHSYFASDVPDDMVSAVSDYNGKFVASVRNNNIFGAQFHPEKSGDMGLEIIKRFGGLEF